MPPSSQRPSVAFFKSDLQSHTLSLHRADSDPEAFCRVKTPKPHLTISPPPSAYLSHRFYVYEVGLGFICIYVSISSSRLRWLDFRTFLFPPVIVTFTKRRVYVNLFLARPLGAEHISALHKFSMRQDWMAYSSSSPVAQPFCGTRQQSNRHIRGGQYVRCLRLDLSGTTMRKLSAKFP